MQRPLPNEPRLFAALVMLAGFHILYVIADSLETIGRQGEQGWQCLLESRSASGAYRLLAPVSEKVPKHEGCWYYGELPAIRFPDSSGDQSEQNSPIVELPIADADATT